MLALMLAKFPGNSTSFKFKEKMTGLTGDDGSINNNGSIEIFK